MKTLDEDIQIEVVRKEGFESAWSSSLAPNEIVRLPVEVELSEEAIPEGKQIARYIISTILEAKRRVYLIYKKYIIDNKEST